MSGFLGDFFSNLFQGVAGHYGYLIVVVVMMIGLYILIAYGNLIKKLIGLGIFQSAVFVLFILLAAVGDAQPPIFEAGGDGTGAFANPLPHVLILTAIVVSIATTALGLSLVMRVSDAWGTLEEEEIPALRDETEDEPRPARD